MCLCPHSVKISLYQNSMICNSMQDAGRHHYLTKNKLHLLLLLVLILRLMVFYKLFQLQCMVSVANLLTLHWFWTPDHYHKGPKKQGLSLLLSDLLCFCLSRCFLGIVSLVFSKFWHVWIFLENIFGSKIGKWDKNKDF